MEKRLNRSDLMFSLAFILMLIIAVGAFFYGVKVGTDRTEAQYAANEAPQATSTAPPSAYQQQDLVSFYHTVFLPYREFQNEWFTAQKKWLADPTADRSASLKELSKSAQKKYDSIRNASVPQISTLLYNAQSSYLKSLKLFNESFSSLSASANGGSSDQLLERMANDSFYKDARMHSLKAQDEYYGSMLMWAASVNSDIPSSYKNDKVLSTSEWKELPLTVKIMITADYLSNQVIMSEYLPHDLTARVDQFIQSGQAEKRKMKSFNAIAELLTSTEAVRNGDFISLKSRFYENEQLPQLPFFFPDKLNF